MNNIQLSIPRPCYEDWNKMTAAEKGRYCGSCQKVVIDFSRMRDADIVSYFKKPKDSVCGRFNNYQLDKEMAIPPKRIPWLKYFFQIAIPAFLISLKASSQTKQLQGRVISKVSLSADSTISDKKNSKPNIGEALQGQVGGVVVRKTEDKSFTVTGKVTDDKGTPIAYASVMIKGTKTGTMSDSIGNFSIRISEQKSALEITAIGHYAKEIQVEGRYSIDAVLVSLNQAWMGEVVVVRHTKKAKRKNEALIKQATPQVEKTKLVEPKVIAIYPNPAPSASEVIIDWKEAVEGSYELQLISEAGIFISKMEIEIATKSSKTNIDLPRLAKGIYIISIINKETKIQQNTKLLIK